MVWVKYFPLHDYTNFLDGGIHAHLSLTKRFMQNKIIYKQTITLMLQFIELAFSKSIQIVSWGLVQSSVDTIHNWIINSLQ